jgi:hypothetical protein
MGRACSKKRTAYRLMLGKPEAKRPLGKPRHRWVDDTKMNLRERERERERERNGSYGLD